MAQKVKILLQNARGLIKKTHKPEIVYYPFIAESATLNDDPFNLDNGNHSWEQQLKIITSAHGIEVHTPDRAKFKNVIGVLFFDNMFYHNLPALKKLHQKNLLEKTIYIDYEPPTGHAKKHEPKSMKTLAKLFKAVATYDDDLVNQGNFIKLNVANFYSKESRRRSFSKKKFAIMVTNNTTLDMIIHSLNYWNNTDYYNDKNIKYHKKAIYHRRLEVVKYFHDNHSDKLDLYGTGFPDEYKSISKGFLDRSKKISTMSGYKFAITFDSYINQNGYISEKVFDAFFAKIVPVYLGADNVLEYIPKECFVDMRDFSSYGDLYQFLSNMSQEEYDRRVDAIEAFLKSDKFKMSFSSKAVAEGLFKCIISPPMVVYDRDRAQRVLDDFETEKNMLFTKNPITPRVDKELINNRWCFVISVKPVGDRLGSLSGKIYAVAGGRRFKVKTYDDKHPELKGNTCMVVAYEDVYRFRKIQFFVDLGKGRSVSLLFLPHVQQLINKTHYDNNNILYANRNIIGCRDVFQKGN